MRFSTILAVVILLAIGGFFWSVSQPPVVAAKVQPTPTPRPESGIAGMGAGATLMPPSRPLEQIGVPGSIVPQASAAPKHH